MELLRSTVLALGAAAIAIGGSFLLLDAMVPGGVLSPTAWWAEVGLTVAGIVELMVVVALMP